MRWPEQFAPTAIRDVEDAAEWLADTAGLEVARNMARATLEAARRIAERPLIGRLRPDLLPAPFRFWPVRRFPFQLVYDAGLTPPPVLRVLHTARDFSRLLMDLPPDLEQDERT